MIGIETTIEYVSPEEVLRRVPSSAQLLIICDKDGTLDHAHQTELVHQTSSGMLRVLQGLTGSASLADRSIHLAIVSGRRLQDLLTLVGVIEGAWYFGTHGVEVQAPGCEAVRSDISNEYFARLDLAESLLQEMLVSRGLMSDGIELFRFELKLELSWQRQTSRIEESLECLDKALRESGLDRLSVVLPASSSREILPRDAGKGGAVERLVSELSPEYVLCAGNDIPDLVMFERLANLGIPHLAAIVGDAVRFAGAVHLRSPEHLESVLDGIRSRLGGNSTASEGIE